MVLPHKRLPKRPINLSDQFKVDYLWPNAEKKLLIIIASFFCENSTMYRNVCKSTLTLNQLSRNEREHSVFALQA